MQNSEAVRALGVTAKQRVDGVMNMLQNLAIGHGPRYEHIQSFSPVQKTIVGRMELLLSCEKAVPGTEQ